MFTKIQTKYNTEEARMYKILYLAVVAGPIYRKGNLYDAIEDYFSNRN